MRRSRSQPSDGLDTVLHLGLFVEQPVHLVDIRPFAHASIDFVESGEQCADRRDSRFHIPAHVETWVEHRLLRNVSDPDPGRRPHRSLVVGFDERHDPQQCALPGPVAPDHADLGPRVKRQPDILEHLFLTVGFGEVFDRENVVSRHEVSLVLSDWVY